MDVSRRSGGGPQRSPLSGSKCSVSPTNLDDAQTKKGQTSTTIDNSSKVQLGIDNPSFESRLQTWVERADASEKENRLEAQRRILDAKETNAKALDLSLLNLTDVTT